MKALILTPYHDGPLPLSLLLTDVDLILCADTA